MHQIYRFSTLTMGLALSFSLPLYAAQPVPLSKTSLHKLQQIIQLKVLNDSNRRGKTNATAKSQPKLLDVLQLIEQHQDAKKQFHIRMQQQYAGFPVFGGYAILHTKTPLDAQGVAQSSVTMNGTVYRDLEQELGQPDPAYTQRASAALDHFKAKYQAYELKDAQVTPIIYIDDEHHAHWAYQVSVFVAHEHSIPEKPTAIIDAHTFEPFVQWNEIKTIHAHVKGLGFGGNQRVGQYQYGRDFPLLDITRDARTALCYLDNAHVKVVDMRHHSRVINTPVSFSCLVPQSVMSEQIYWTGEHGYNPINGAYSPENDALYIGTVIHEMYQSWYGVLALEERNLPMKLVMRLHFSKEYENAFWDGRAMTFGDGGDYLYPLVSLTVGAHEISHGFTEQHSGLNYFGESGAMNESFSDMAAQAAEYYSKGASSWQIGEEIMKEASGIDALRYLDDPTRDGYSIDSADKYEKGLDVHFASGVYNRMFYLLATQPGWNPRLAFHVMVKANMDYWTPFSKFSDGACGILNAARDLNYSTDAVKVALDGVAIDYQSC